MPSNAQPPKVATSVLRSGGVSSKIQARFRVCEVAAGGVVVIIVAVGGRASSRQ